MTSNGKDQVDISQHILEKIPPEAEVTRIEYEGPALAVYTKKTEVLPKNTEDLQKKLKFYKKILKFYKKKIKFYKKKIKI